MTLRRDTKEPTPEAQLRSWIARLDPKVQTLARSVRAAVRKRFPTANELAYDYTRFVVIGYSPTENGIDAVVAIAARPTGAFLYFSQGPKLPDPKHLLQGKAKQVRFVQLDAASQLKDPDVKAFLSATIDQARIPFAPRGKGSLMIKGAAQKL